MLRNSPRDRDKVVTSDLLDSNLLVSNLVIKMSSQHLNTRQSRQTKTKTAAATKMKSFSSSKRHFHFFMFVFQIGLLFQPANALRQSHYVHWNTTNPIFRIDNTDHIIDVNRGNKPWEYDQVNIICPVYRAGTHIDDIETYVIYSVSKDEYDSCRITNPNPRVIAICDKPHEVMYFTITFRSFTPTPGGMEFQPGEDYYFISTSAKGDLYRRAGGHCSSHHMKVAFKVANNQNEDLTTSTSKPRPVVNVPRHYGHDGDAPLRLEPTENDRDEEDADEDLLHNFWSGKGYFGGNYARPIAPSGGRPNKKRDDNFDRHPNEVVKHEASRMASAGRSLQSSNILLILLFIVAKTILN